MNIVNTQTYYSGQPANNGRIILELNDGTVIIDLDGARTVVPSLGSIRWMEEHGGYTSEDIEALVELRMKFLGLRKEV